MPTRFKINTEVANKFYSKAKILQAKGERYKFKSISYYRAAKVIEGLDKGLDEIYKHGWLVGLQKINGVGNRLAHEIETELKKLGINK